ncbi:MAG: DUF4037 domain-containing protein [bacterium]|nr:DUF4037 domain-containing protein [bacterium]
MNDIIEKFSQITEVEAIAIGGSVAAKTCDNTSDTDIYVFSKNGIPIEKRKKIIEKISKKYEVGAEYFGSGDEFLCDRNNTIFDMMYWDMKWFEDIVENVWIKHFPSNGYTTCFLYTLKNFQIVYDPNNWLKNLQDKIKTDYPSELQKNIIGRNLKLMKDKPFASYYEQIEKAVNRNDVNSINHRTAAFLASYFDIIFAKNKLLHPGEKKLIKYAKENCKILPENFAENIEKLLSVQNSDILAALDEIIRNVKNTGNL